MKLVLISDIHANLSAFENVIEHSKKNYGEEVKYAHLGDCINYGMRPNEVVSLLKKLNEKILVNLFGNHEAAIFSVEDNRFSSERGNQALDYTKELLSSEFLKYISDNFSKEPVELLCDDKKILFVHGSLSDKYWGNLNSAEMEKEIYSDYDFVISGHTHRPFFNEVLFNKIDSEKRIYNKTVFINPGSVGQPRNNDPNAQYAVIDFHTGEFFFHKVKYDILSEQLLYETGKFDKFYSERLKTGV